MLGSKVDDVSDSASRGESISLDWDWKLLSEVGMVMRRKVRRAVTRATAWREGHKEFREGFETGEDSKRSSKREAIGTRVQT